MRALVIASLIFSACFVALEAQAREKTEFYTGVRMLGMGGVSVAIANDETAVFSNPAALGKLRDPFITVVDPEVHYGADTSSFLTGFDLNVLGVKSLLEKINDHPGRNLHIKMQLFPSVVVPNFAAGVLIKYDINGALDSTNSEIDLNYTNDFAGVLGYNLRLFDGRLKIGFSGRYINRSQITDSNPIPTTNLDLTLKDIAQNGGAIAADAGIMITMPWATLPTLAVTGRDLGNTSFGLGAGFASGTGERPTTVKQTVDGAIAFHPILGNRTRMTISFEMRDVMSTDADDKADIYRRLHGGLEINLGDIFFVRGGMNQRYWTAGLEFTMANFQFQVASYGEEIGTAAVHQEDRRYIGKFAYRF